MSHLYEGDVSPRECFAALTKDRDSFLIDVRTRAEWTFVGVPALGAGDRAPLFQEWQTYPSMAIDADFAGAVGKAVEDAGGSKASRLFFLCRSGARSMASAAALTAAGFAHCFNVADGFEGPPNAEGHRGTVSGWKAEGLPWMQR